VDNRTEIRDFLATRRAKLTPEQVGLPNAGRRRVPGLRREEVAVLAGVSPDWYIRLEKGHISGVSDDVLDAVARALQLSDVEREHLFNLARAAKPSRTPRRRSKTQIPASVQRVLDSMTGTAAFVRNGRLDILASNALGRALYCPVLDQPAHRGSIARFDFLDPRASDYYPDYDGALSIAVALLRTEAGRNPARQGPHRPDRRTRHSKRSVPHPLGSPRRPHPPWRRQDVQPSGRRPPRTRLRLDGAGRCTRPRPHGLHRRTRHIRRRPCTARVLGRH
jgi:transcriptional regulator with XRE-family HTH domain